MTVGSSCGAVGRLKNIRCLLFDLDDTLYRVEAVAKKVRLNIENYMEKYLNIPSDKVSFLTNELYVQYGTTLAGLAATGHKIDFDHWHQLVHGSLDYDNLIHEDGRLRDILQSIQLPKLILTNADMKHTEVCLSKLGIKDCFQGIYCFETIMGKAGTCPNLCLSACPVLCKPNPGVYRFVVGELGLPANEVMFFDDSARNISSASGVGLLTVLVGKDTPVLGADYVLPSLHQMPAVFPEFFEHPSADPVACPSTLSEVEQLSPRLVACAASR